jgi:hypothetical protein
MDIREFMEWFEQNYPKETVIMDPVWHGLKIWKAAQPAQAIVVGWANRHDLADVISDKQKQLMITVSGLENRLLAEKYSIPLIQRN